MRLQEKLEWALMTLRDQLKFGLPESEAIKRREGRVRGVLIDAVKELPLIEQQLKEANDALILLSAKNSAAIDYCRRWGLVCTCVEYTQADADNLCFPGPVCKIHPIK